MDTAWTWSEVGMFIAEYSLVLMYTVYTQFEFIFKRLFPGPLKDLSGEIILVTGSGRGIGREICIQLGKLGAQVVCWSRSAGPNEEVVRKIVSDGGRAYAYTVDVADRAQVEKTAAKVKADLGDVTMVINNAGRMSVLPFLDTPPSEIESLFKVNVLSNFWILRQFLPNMIEQKRGHIVSVCSASGILPIRCIAAYASTKHAVTGYMEALQDEILHHPEKPDIKFTTAYPFYCKTEMLEEGVPHSRFPYLFPIVTAEVIAKNLIQGIRREHQYLYIPPLIGWLAMFSWLVTPKANIAHREFLEMHIDPVEQKKDK